MKTDRPENPDPTQSPNHIQIRRLSQIFWALELLLMVALVQRLALNDISGVMVLLIAAILLIASTWLSHHNRVQLGAGWMLYLMTALVFYFLWAGEGVRDEAVLGYPAILVLSSIISTARVFISLLVVMVVSLLAIGLANTTGWYVNTTTGSHLNAAVILVMILMVTGYSIRLLINDIRRLVLELSDENRRHQESRDHIEKLVNHDALTGLPNRVLVEDRFQNMVHESRRSGAQVALVFIDLDNFKPINDSMGHSVGDDYLRTIASRLEQQLRMSDTVARFGGDEFVLLMGNMTDQDTIADRVQELLMSLRQPIWVEGHELTTTASIGIALAPQDAETFSDLLRMADMAMYESKGAGRNNLHFYNTTMNVDAQSHIRNIADLRRAIPGDQLSLYFQPKIDLKTGELAGAEALLRWRHPTRGFVPPSEFIPLAERSGLIIDIGNWVVEQACASLLRLDEHGFGGQSMAINVSALQFRRGDVQRVIVDAVRQSGISAKRLELEFTESMLVDGGTKLAAVLSELRAMGLTFSIDDFGTGYSNLGYLKELEVSTLKIDRSFVSRMHLREQDIAIVRAIIQMATSLKLSTVAEGVENVAERDLLAELGCTLGQGFYWSQPLPEAEFIRYLADVKATPGMD